MTKLEDIEMAIDWRRGLKSPPSYRIGNSTLRIQTKFIWVITLLGLFLLIIFYITPKTLKNDSSYRVNVLESLNYNYTYPLSAPIKSNGLNTFRIGLISDLDTSSKCSDRKHTYRSFLKRGFLSFSPSNSEVVVSWDKMEPTELTSSYSLKGRGMELSELIVFNGKLLSFDDRTGMVFEIVKDHVIPWVLLVDGNGNSAKGFKSEWATVKNNVLVVGSMGKEWTTESGDFESIDPQFVKMVNVKGEVRHENWMNNYNAIRAAIGIHWPGYMIHECASWSDVHQRWFFLPRRCSKERYNDTRDERMGCNVMITADEHFQDIQVTKIGELEPTHGFSSFKFVPGSEDKIIVALKTQELNGVTATYIMAFNINGRIILPENKVSDLKYEGIEFI